jgi:hypothetical protein
MQEENGTQPRRCKMKIPIGSGGVVICPIGGAPVLLSVVEKSGQAVTIQIFATVETKVLRTEQLSGEKREGLDFLEGVFRGWFKRWGHSLRGRRSRFVGWDRGAEQCAGDCGAGADGSTGGTAAVNGPQSDPKTD